VLASKTGLPETVYRKGSRFHEGGDQEEKEDLNLNSKIPGTQYKNIRI